MKLSFILIAFATSFVLGYRNDEFEAAKLRSSNKALLQALKALTLTAEQEVASGRGQQPIKQNPHRINEQIRGVREVRLTDSKGESVGVVSIQEAIAAAEEAGMDLVEVSPNAEPPVCRIMDYGKFLFEKSKSAREQKKKQNQVQIKEVKFRPGTDIGDYQVKLRNLTRFLEDGNKVKVTIRFRGREMADQDIGVDILHRLKEDTVDFAVVESFPSRIEGRQMVMVLAPKKLR